MREILPVEQKQHREQRQMITREQVIMHQQNLVRIRAEIPKRKMHRQRVNAAKKKVKKILASTGIGIALGLAFFYALASDTYEPPKAEPRMVARNSSLELAGLYKGVRFFFFASEMLSS